MDGASDEPKPRLQSAYRPRVLKRWTTEETEKLLSLVESHGCNWTRVSAFLPGRTARRCSERWYALQK